MRHLRNAATSIALASRRSTNAKTGPSGWPFRMLSRTTTWRAGVAVSCASRSSARAGPGPAQASAEAIAAAIALLRALGRDVDRERLIRIVLSDQTAEL